ncbi:MAG TPA: ABC transporter permease [Ktedonobacteraceae bacterium]|nr:ABC transporter permease [Ktedonobacteraceae bacterium]
MKIAFLALSNEIHKRILIAWNYKFNLMSQVVLVTVIFVGASFLLGKGQFNPNQLSTLFIGYIVWFYARITIMGTSMDLKDEAEAGTLEQTYMTPAPSEFLLLGRMLAMLFIATVMVLLASLVLLLLLHIPLSLSWAALPVLLLTLAGLLGFTLILGGATLVYKQIEGLADLIQNLLLFVTGSLLPVTDFPGWLATLARTLPITEGIEVLRQILLQGQSLSSTWSSGSLRGLVLNSVVYLSAGWLIFKWSEHIAKKQGTLGHY